MSESRLTKDRGESSRRVWGCKWEIVLMTAPCQRAAVRNLLPDLLALSSLRRVAQATAFRTSGRMSL